MRRSRATEPDDEPGPERTGCADLPQVLAIRKSAICTAFNAVLLFESPPQRHAGKPGVDFADCADRQRQGLNAAGFDQLAGAGKGFTNEDAVPNAQKIRARFLACGNYDPAQRSE